jgi:hypothetical protein
VFAFLWNQNKSCKFYKEQTLFNGHELDQCLTWLKSAHKVKNSVVLGLRFLVKSKMFFSFNVPDLGAL